MPTLKKTIDSYSKYAKKWASNMRSGKNLAHEYLEKPAMYRLLPSLKGKSILCVGCGSGEECDILKKSGAIKVVGTDISKGLIAEAKIGFPKLEFHVMDMEKLKFPSQSVDIVYSSLTMHYVKEWLPILKNIKSILKPGGVFLFSTHHPVKWGGETVRGQDRESFLLGYEKIHESGGKKIVRVHGDYFKTRLMHDRWFGEMDVSYWHKPLSEILTEIRNSGLVIEEFVEPRPIGKGKRLKPEWDKIPMFMIFKLVKPK